MSGDLVPSSNFPVVSRRGRELRAIRHQTEVTLTRESVEAAVRRRRIDQGIDLAAHAAFRLAILDRTVVELSRDNLALELGLRMIESSVAAQIGNLIQDYFQR